jgi:hypothetical protein
LWVEHVEFNKLDELISIDVDVGWNDNSVEFQVANNLKSKEHTPEVIHTTL